MITLTKPSSLPELPETIRMKPLNEEKTLYQEVPEEQQIEEIKEAVEKVIDETEQQEAEDEEEQKEVSEPRLDEIVLNHEQRLQAIESILLRIRGAI
jgi:RNase adaptor protein for sRNA GlmZ degradation